LNPNEEIHKHFVDGDSFGVYGDIVPADDRQNEKREEEKIPMTILTGFLGSGKTTMLNYILKEQNERKIAIIENEFGEISIDDELLNQDKMNLAEKIITLDNGCVCCTIRGDLEDGLMQMVDAIKKGHNIEQIILETTGMADPVPIVRTFMAAEKVTKELRLDAVISMADAKHLADRLDEDIEEGQTNVAYQQVAFADKIILNKLDLVTTEQAIALKDRIRGINKFARVLGAIKGRVRLSELLNIRAHDMVNFADMDINAEGGADLGYDQHGGHGSGGHGYGHGGHGSMEVDHGGGHGGREVDG